MTPERRYHPRPLVFRKGHRTNTYLPTDKVHDKAIRGVMARHGWRLMPGPPVSPDEPTRATTPSGGCR